MATTTYYGRFTAALRAAVDTFRSVYQHPGATEDRSAAATRRDFYDVILAYYSNTIYDDVAAWINYVKRYGLYPYTRSLINPVGPVVDFYAEHVYSGVWTVDASRLPDGTQIAVPFTQETSQELRDCIGQFWQWSNWPTQQSIEVTYGALCGNVLVEPVDDLEREKIYTNIRWPSQVDDLELDGTGNVKSYALEYMVTDRRSGKRFRYRKEVSGEAFTFFRDDQRTETYDNPYGFCPAVWIKHIDLGGTFGVGAIRSGQGQIDELNSVVSHLHDHIHKGINSPRIIFTDSQKISFALPQTGEPDADDYDSRQETLLLKAGASGSTSSLVGEVNHSQVDVNIARLLGAIKDLYPEIEAYKIMRSMSTLTGPAADRLLGDVRNRKDRSAGNYDAGNIKLFQMQAAMGGFRLASGDWTQDTPAQRKYGPFDLTSYERGELDAGILQRPLVQPTSREVADEIQVRATTVGGLVTATIYDDTEALSYLGKTPEQITEIQRRKSLVSADDAGDPLDGGDGGEF